MTIQNQMVRGAAWMVGARLTIKALGFISTLVLARLLTPADFGIVALATAFLASITLIKTFSFDVALIQDQEAGADKYDTAWTLNLVFSVVLGAALFLLAKPAAEFFGDARLAGVITLLSLTVFLEGLENIGTVDFRKHLDFRSEFIFLISQKVAGFLVKIPLAFVLKSYWALVIGIVVSSVVGLVMSYVMHPFRPKLGLRSIGELFNFSKWLFLNNLLYFVRHKAADFVIGRRIGASSVGLFSVSYEIAHLVTGELVAPINRAVFPGYSKMAGDGDRLKLGYLKVMSVIAITAIPAATGIAAIADVLVPILLGDKWFATTPLIKVLAFSGAISILETNIGAAYLAMGRPRILTFLYTFFATTFVIGLLILIPRYGVTGAAWASLIACIINIPLQVFMMRRHLQISMRDLYGVFFRPIVAAAMMYGTVRVFFDVLGHPEAMLAQIGVSAALAVIGAATYVLVTLGLWLLAKRPDGPESYIYYRFVETS